MLVDRTTQIKFLLGFTGNQLTSIYVVDPIGRYHAYYLEFCLKVLDNKEVWSEILDQESFSGWVCLYGNYRGSSLCGEKPIFPEEQSPTSPR